MAGPFKMKGSPMARNFGVGSPLHNDKKSKSWSHVEADGDKNTNYFGGAAYTAKTDSLPSNYDESSYLADAKNAQSNSKTSQGSSVRVNKYKRGEVKTKTKTKETKPKANKKKTTIKYGGTAGKI